MTTENSNSTNTEKAKRDRIFLSDGRSGIQERHQQENGDWLLTSVLITKLADGTRVRDVYARRSDLQARVYGFGDLGNVTWEIRDDEDLTQTQGDRS